ncbi:transmembrane channel-like protein 7 [Diadema antillarum]|uniref:transmembrane channel-like protein 7 n=1 Tax=Diadema antillarum TaxID=105358 RepID=UPI003A89C2AB
MSDSRRRHQHRGQMQGHANREYVNVELGYDPSGYGQGPSTAPGNQYENMELNPDMRYGAQGVDNLAYSSPTGSPRPGYHRDDIQLTTIKPSFGSTGETPLVGRSRTASEASSISYRSSNADEDEIRERERIAASLKDPNSVIDMLPSRQLGHTLSRVKSYHSSSSNRPQRKRSRTASLRRTRSTTRRNYENVNLDTMVDEILSNPSLTEGTSRGTLRRRNTIRQISGTIDTRRRVREQVKRESRGRKEKSLGLCTYWFYELAYKWESFVESLSDFTYSLELWRNSIKEIEGNFGSGVTSYFLLLKWLLLLNIPVFFLSLGFISTPQFIYQPSARYNHSETFSGWDLLTGAGWFKDTELYCGYYTNETFSVDGKNSYSMPLAYLFTSVGFFLIILIVIAQGMSKAYRQYFVTGDRHYNFFTARAFCGWDYSITSESTAKLRNKSIYLELAEALSSHHETNEFGCCKQLGIYLLRLVVNITVLGIIAGACYIIIFMYENVVDDIDTEIMVIRELAVPLIIGGYNLILPYMFSVLSSLEKYSNPRMQLYVALFRTFLMKASVLCVLYYFWFNRISCTEGQANNCVECWETFIGTEVYKLVIIDFILQSLATFFLEFIRRVGRDHCCQSFASPEFDIARNTMDLIQTQTYTWIGMYFAPLLMVVNIFKLVVIFYVKKVSVLYNCKPSLRPWKAGLAKTVFLGILFLMYLICLGAIGYSIVQIEPSDSCGPFRGRNATYDVVIDLFSRWQESEKVISTVVVILTNPGILVAVILILSLLVYYRRSVAMGYKETVKRLKNQINLEGKDKRFLLRMLQDAIKKRNKALGITSENGSVVVGGASSSALGYNGRFYNSSPSPVAPLSFHGTDSVASRGNRSINGAASSIEQHQLSPQQWRPVSPRHSPRPSPKGGRHNQAGSSPRMHHGHRR